MVDSVSLDLFWTRAKIPDKAKDPERVLAPGPCLVVDPEGDRTLDLTDANRTRSQLRYGPTTEVIIALFPRNVNHPERYSQKKACRATGGNHQKLQWVDPIEETAGSRTGIAVVQGDEPGSHRRPQSV